MAGNEDGLPQPKHLTPYARCHYAKHQALFIRAYQYNCTRGNGWSGHTDKGHKARGIRRLMPLVIINDAQS